MCVPTSADEENAVPASVHAAAPWARLGVPTLSEADSLKWLATHTHTQRHASPTALVSLQSRNPPKNLYYKYLHATRQSSK